MNDLGDPPEAHEPNSGGGGANRLSSPAVAQSENSVDTPAAPRQPTTTSESATNDLLAVYTRIELYHRQIKAPASIVADVALLKQASQITAAQSRISLAGNFSTAATTANAIYDIQKQVQEIKTYLRKQTPANSQPAGLDADAVKRGGLSQPTVLHSSAKPIPLRHDREITISNTNKDPQLVSKTHKDIIDSLNKAGVEGTVIALRKLPSTDIVITLSSAAEQKHWIQNTTWLTTFGEGARIKRRQYTVLALSRRELQPLLYALSLIQINPMLTNHGA